MKKFLETWAITALALLITLGGTAAIIGFAVWVATLMAHGHWVFPAILAFLILTTAISVDARPPMGRFTDWFGQAFFITMISACILFIALFSGLVCASIYQTLTR